MKPAAESIIRRSVKKAVAARHLNCIVTETFDLAKSQFEQAVHQGQSPFTMTIKDCFAVANVRMTCASAMLHDYVAPYTATCVRRLVENGGCLVGKSNMDEFAMGSTSAYSHFGPVKNSYHINDPSIELSTDFHVAGGSSGGCAVAVSIGIADVAVGTDTGGSTRSPAAFNGVFGFKPSYGRLSRHGMVALANSLDTPSIFARSATDCRKYFDIMRGIDQMDSNSVDFKDLEDHPFMKTGDLSGLIVGIPTEYRNSLLSEDSLRAWNDAATMLRARGASVREVSLPNTDHTSICYYILADSDVASNMARYDGIRYGYREDDDPGSFIESITRNRTKALNFSVKRRIFGGNFYNLRENQSKCFYEQAAKVRRLIQLDFRRVFHDQRVDVLLTPTTSHSAPLYSDVCATKYRVRQCIDDYFTQPANMCGLPAISVPFSKSSKGLPLGIQLICAFGQDSLCLALAEHLEQLIRVNQR